MICPPELAAILAEILTLGLLRIRNEPMEFRQVAVEADHLHNLPDLLSRYTPQKLLYYWDVERPCYLRHVGPGGRGRWMEDPWERLEWYVQEARDRMGHPDTP